MQVVEGWIFGLVVVYDYKFSRDFEVEQVNIELEYLGGYVEVVVFEYMVLFSGVMFYEGVVKKYVLLVFV